MDILINMPTFNDYMILSTPSMGGSRDYMILSYLTQEEEENLSAGRQINIIRGDKGATITKGSCIFWGNMDFTRNSEDCQTMDKYDLVGTKTKDVIIPANYDYDSHTCKTPDVIGKYLFTTAGNSSEVLRYKHACLGKPERVILFKAKQW